jgi:acyl-CoA reductase-like NAD-dependent aldehyde dehydrogenase
VDVNEALAEVRRADEAWQTARTDERDRMRERIAAIKAAHAAGAGYGTIAAALATVESRTYVQQVVRGDYDT